MHTTFCFVSWSLQHKSCVLILVVWTRDIECHFSCQTLCSSAYWYLCKELGKIDHVDQFHKHFNRRFYACRSQKRKIYRQLISVFLHFWDLRMQKLLDNVGEILQWWWDVLRALHLPTKEENININIGFWRQHNWRKKFGKIFQSLLQVLFLTSNLFIEILISSFENAYEERKW